MHATAYSAAGHTPSHSGRHYAQASPFKLPRVSDRHRKAVVKGSQQVSEVIA